MRFTQLRSFALKPRDMRVLCVAEKPSISKAVAGHLSGGSFSTVRTRGFSENYPDVLFGIGLT